MDSGDKILQSSSSNDSEGVDAINQSRRTANYKPTIWDYDSLEALANEYAVEKYISSWGKLLEDNKNLFKETVDTVAKLELIEKVGELGLFYLFQLEIKESLDAIASDPNMDVEKDNLYASALCFMLLRKHGYSVSQDMLVALNKSTDKLTESSDSDVKAMLKLFEACNLLFEGESILEEAQMIMKQNLETICKSNVCDSSVGINALHALEVPMNYRVEWYDAKRQLNQHEEHDKNILLLKLGKLNFNIVQATHQKELRDICRWWKKLGISESLNFTRNRIVESYLWTVGVVYEPHYGSLRKWMAKAIKLVLVIDDVYDAYGTLQELELLTGAVDRWDFEGTNNLPECLKICLQTLYDTVNEIADEMKKELEWDLVSPHLQQVWADFCKALLVEAKWYHNKYTPSVQEYIGNGWISSSGPILSLHIFFSVALTHGPIAEEAMELLQSMHNLVYNVSLIIRLSNDLGTSAAEVKRGDASSSVLCYMSEEKLCEEMARKQIQNLMANTWKKINHYGYITQSQFPQLQQFVKCTTNIARVAQFIYQNGDGFGVPDQETRDKVLSLLIEPLPID